MVQKEEIISQFKKRVFDESYHRIFICLNLINDEQLWLNVNPEVPAIGNLILHVCGNARQWILSGIGGKRDNRDRDLEFMDHSDIKKAELIFLMENLRVNLIQVLNEMPANKLNEIHRIQGFSESGFSVIIHVIEHFSYHTGQISTLTKLFTGKELGFYNSKNLNDINK